jgi:hypothetical protein
MLIQNLVYTEHSSQKIILVEPLLHSEHVPVIKYNIILMKYNQYITLKVHIVNYAFHGKWILKFYIVFAI